MIDKTVLGRHMMMIVGLGAVCAIAGKDGAALALSGAAIVLFAIHQSIGPPTIPKRTLRFFVGGGFLGAESSMQWQDFVRKNENDPEFATVIAFLTRLSPEQFLSFTRTVVEFRYALEQNTLSAVSQYIRRYYKKGNKQ